MKATNTFLNLGLNLKEALLLLFLICISGFSTIIQFITLFIFSFVFLFLGRKVKYVYRWVYYISLLGISLIQLMFVWRTDYSVNYIINTVIIAFMWFLALQGSNIIIRGVTEINIEKVEKILKIFFQINLFFVVLQIIIMGFEMQTFFPFSNMSAGDNVKGLFRNSSVNMIIMSFFTVYYFTKKDYIYAILSFLITALTFYMSGMLFFIGIVVLYGFLNFSFKNKVKVFTAILISLFLFIQFSPENVKYVKRILMDKISSKTDPPRKLVSFEQTLDYWFSDPVNFIFGSGGGKFSSRTAFITGGEYVGWFPEKFTYLSKDFKENHFQLWSYKILSIPYKDGTSNQPFSFYNKIIGEYGLIGIVLFLIYLIPPIKYYKHITYGKIMFLLIFAYFLLDYWFEYFSVIIFLELFIFLDIKGYLQKTTNNG